MFTNTKKLKCASLTRAFLIAACSIFFINTANARFLFIDNFSDGDAEDGSPVTWATSEFQGGGNFEVVDGDLIVSLTHSLNLMIPQIPLLGDISFRWQARVLSFAGNGYWLQIAYGDDEVVSRYGGRLRWDEEDGETDGRLKWLRSQSDLFELSPSITAQNGPPPTSESTAVFR